MSTRRSTSLGKCYICRQSVVHCFCDLIKTYEGTTHVSFIMHYRERYLPSNTAHLFHLLYPNSKTLLRGIQDKPINPEDLFIDGHQPLVLFPSEEAIELNYEFARKLTKPVQLIVPDGRWKQVRNVADREPFLKDLPRVMLPLTTAPSNYRLRRAPKPNAVSTFEACARSLAFFENPPLAHELENIFIKMMDRAYSAKPL